MSLEFDVIGPYNIVRILGQGGMGTVYHGVHTKTNDPVAIKVIAANMAQHQRFRRRFDAEIQTLLKLKHPSIVQLIGFGEEKGLLFYSMEYVDGENLQQQLRREKRLPWERVVDHAIDICSALKHAHDFGIIHRDLKPANVMINSQGRVKLTDFGIAKLFGAADATVAGSVLGTADFMPPEQAEGKPVSVRSDLYSLGSTCYAALTGRPPFVGKNIPEILFNVRYGTLVPIQDIVDNVPQELCDIVHELLNREPSKRPPTGLVVGNRLQALRLGLAARTKTQLPGGPNSVGDMKEMTSIDMRDLETGVSIPSMNLPGVPGDATMVVPNPASKKTNESATNPSMASGVRHTGPSVAGPNDKTRIAISNDGFELVDSPSGVDQLGKTNFTEVRDDDRRRTTITSSVPDEISPWAKWISVGMLVGLLVVCTASIVWFLQPQSASVLYSEIAAAVESGDEEAMIAIEPTIDRFVELYPNDARVDEVTAFKSEIANVRSVRRLQRRARYGGTDQLDAVEQAFLECLKAQAIDSELAKRKLTAMVNLFSSTEQLTNRQQQMVEQAKRVLDKLASEPPQSRNPSLEFLEQQMRWAETNLSPATRAAWLKSLVELFQDKPWARNIVEEAKKAIATLDKPAKDSNP